MAFCLFKYSVVHMHIRISLEFVTQVIAISPLSLMS